MLESTFGLALLVMILAKSSSGYKYLLLWPTLDLGFELGFAGLIWSECSRGERLLTGSWPLPWVQIVVTVIKGLTAVSWWVCTGLDRKSPEDLWWPIVITFVAVFCDIGVDIWTKDQRGGVYKGTQK